MGAIFRWFEARAKGVGRKQQRPIDELCSVSSDSSSTCDATSARWYVTFVTRVACQSGACSTDARDAGGSFFGRKRERARRRMKCQSLVEVVAGDPCSDRHLDTNIDVRVTSQSTAQSFFLGWEAGADALGSRAQETSLECMIFHVGGDFNTSAYRARGMAKLSSI